LSSNIPPNIEMNEKLQINLFNTLDYEELSYLILKLDEDKSLVSKQIIHNLANVGYYDWKNISKKYVDLFELTQVK